MVGAPCSMNETTERQTENASRTLPAVQCYLSMSHKQRHSQSDKSRNGGMCIKKSKIYIKKRPQQIVGICMCMCITKGMKHIH